MSLRYSASNGAAVPAGRRASAAELVGRVGVFQLMMMNDELAEVTTQRPSRDTLRRAAMAAGMRSLREDGLDKVARGLTTLAELERALP